MPYLIFLVFLLFHGSCQRFGLQRRTRSLSVGSITIENNTNDPVKVQIRSSLIPTGMKLMEVQLSNQTASQFVVQEGFTKILPKRTVEVNYNTFVQTNNLARCSIYLSDLTRIMDSETVKNNSKYKLQRFGDIYFLELMENQCLAAGCTPWRPEWKNLDTNAVFNPILRIFSTKKRILYIRQKKNFTEAKRICHSICGKIFLPISSQENQEAVNLLNEIQSKIQNRKHNMIWLRATDRIWINYFKKY